jgi:hypothetical protein
MWRLSDITVYRSRLYMNSRTAGKQHKFKQHKGITQVQELKINTGCANKPQGYLTCSLQGNHHQPDYRCNLWWRCVTGARTSRTAVMHIITIYRANSLHVCSSHMVQYICEICTSSVAQHSHGP